VNIGPYQLANNLILAPMAGVTDLPFRRLCRSMGAGLAVSEMVTTDASLRGSRKTVLRLDHTDEPAPISVQIVGTDPDVMAQAAQANIDHGAQIIDINMGCPAKKVCKVAAGSALMQNPELVERILDRVVNAVDVPVTLKIRTGWNTDHRNALQIARIAEQNGIQSLAIHGRTRACGYSGTAEYETIKEVKSQINIPVIANGDIDSPQKAAEVLAKTGVDALMIGRAAQGRPWLFRQISQYLESGQLVNDPTPTEIKNILLKHLDNLYAFYGEYMGVRVGRKHIGWYSKTLPGNANFKNIINRAESPEDQIRIISDFFDRFDTKEGKVA